MLMKGMGVEYTQTAWTTIRVLIVALTGKGPSEVTVSET